MLISVFAGTEYFLASWIAVYTIEKFGRRKLMLFGAIGQTATMALLTITTYLATAPDAAPFGGKDNTGAGIGAAVLLFVFNSFFAIGKGLSLLYNSLYSLHRLMTGCGEISPARSHFSLNLRLLAFPRSRADSVLLYALK